MPVVANAVVLYRQETEPLLERVRQFAQARQIGLRAVPVERFLAQPQQELGDAERVVVLSGDADVADVLAQAQDCGASVGILPVSPDSIARQLYKIPRDLDAALALAFEEEALAIDIMQCNGEVVLGMLMLGDTPFLDRRSRAYLAESGSWFSRAWRNLVLLLASLRGLFRIRHFPITLVTGKDVQIRTSVTGIVVIENETDARAARLVNSSISGQDGKVSVLLIAPESIGEYLQFLLAALLSGEKPGQRLPDALAYIKSSGLRITSRTPLVHYIDGKRREAEELRLQVYPKAVRLCVSERYQARHEASEAGKDTMKVENLPTDAARLEMISRRLPVFAHALEDEFKDLFLLLKDNARLKADYVALMFLSAIVASLGLFLDSSAVIIGAMVLAPLMAPIISLAMGILRDDRLLLRRASASILAGMLIALATAALLAWLIPLQRTTSEIAARLQPSLLDLGVAIVSGIAGGFAHAREHVMKSLPGVAIAVALVPPLCVAGIGIGWLDLQVVSGAFLLFLTNLVGIALAAAATFLVLGFGPINRVSIGVRGVGSALAAMLLVSVPLYFSFEKIQRHWQIEHQLSTGEFAVNGKLLRFSDVQVNLLRDEVRVSANVSCPAPLENADMQALKELLQNRWRQPVRLEVGYRMTL